jgi:hypothetical protein
MSCFFNQWLALHITENPPAKFIMQALELAPAKLHDRSQCSSGATMIEAPTLRRSLGQDREDISEVVSDNGNDGIHGSRNANEEIIPGSCLMQQVRYKLPLHFDDHIDPLFSRPPMNYKIRSDMCRCSSQRTPVATHGHTPSINVRKIVNLHGRQPT